MQLSKFKRIHFVLNPSYMLEVTLIYSIVLPAYLAKSCSWIYFDILISMHFADMVGKHTHTHIFIQLQSSDAFKLKTWNSNQRIRKEVSFTCKKDLDGNWNLHVLTIISRYVHVPYFSISYVILFLCDLFILFLSRQEIIVCTACYDLLPSFTYSFFVIPLAHGCRWNLIFGCDRALAMSLPSQLWTSSGDQLASIFIVLYLLV